jgi:translation initiation factor 6
MKRTSYFGNTWIGVFAKTNDTHTIVPIDAMDKFVHALQEELKTEVIMTTLGNTNLHGIYCAMNSNGIILPNVTEDKEVQELKKKLGINVYRSKEHNNAHGNNISVNDKGGIINPIVSPLERKKMEDTLGVELVAAEVAHYHTVGSCTLTTNKGFLTHFQADDKAIELLGKALKTNGSKGSVNTGTGFVALGALANSKGYVAGEHTTAFEMGRMEEALGFL